MKRLARWIARNLWWASLWLMRRPWMRRLQAASINWLPTPMATRARANLIRQNALGRRIGLRLINFMVLLILVSVAIQMVYSAAVYLVSSGVLAPRKIAGPGATGVGMSVPVTRVGRSP